MIIAVCIQMNRSLIVGGYAVVKKDNNKKVIDFDVVKGEPLQVIVGGRGKRVPDEFADWCEEQLLELFKSHQVPLSIGLHNAIA
ncbi:hypothetical protein ACE41H_15575 [Paenibacillus enshidis]|uniref:Uncharacterized protein n=1 Tax=Paenibacillus enshidis TaxID=1458439 RepID=A0ABV5AVF3_9BACL